MRDPTRPVTINFGQGVVNEYWKGRGSCTGDQKYYSLASRDADILSFDIYPIGSATPQVKGRLEYIAQGVARLKEMAVGSQTVWAAIETTALDPLHMITPAQLRAEIWMAIIHGARGIVYFVHEFSPTFRSDGIFRHPEIVEKVTEEDALINSLSTVLSSPNVNGVLEVQSGFPVATMIKRDRGAVYVFAVAMTDAPSKSKFTLKGLNATAAHALGEGRRLKIKEDAFVDSFEGYGVHIYQIPIVSLN